MISSQFIIGAGIVTALLWIPAGLRLYKMAVPLHWLFALAFFFGSLGIAFFYYEIEYSLIGIGDLISFSRALWVIVELTTALLAVSILVYRR